MVDFMCNSSILIAIGGLAGMKLFGDQNSEIVMNLEISLMDDCPTPLLHYSLESTKRQKNIVGNKVLVHLCSLFFFFHLFSLYFM